MAERPSDESSDAFAPRPYHPSDQEGILEQVISGALGADEAAKLLEIPVGRVLRLSRERASLHAESPGEKELGEEFSEQISDNWDKAQEGYEPVPEELPPVEGIIQSFAPARWLFGTERRRYLFAAGTCTTVVGGLFLVSQRPPAEVPVDAKTIERQVVVPLPNKSDYERAKQIAQEFLAEPGWEKRLNFVRNPEEVRLLMKDWHDDRGHPVETATAVHFTEAKGTFFDSTPFVILETRTESSAPLVLALDMSGNEPKVDWGSHVHYQPISWEEFKKNRPTEALRFRVRAEPSDYFIEPYDDSDRYLSLRLTSPLAVIGLNGFVERESKLGLQLGNLLEFRNKKQKNLTLTLRFSENSTAPAVEILEAFEGWLLP